MAKKKFSKEFLLYVDHYGDVQVCYLNGRWVDELCGKIFRPAFKMGVKDIPLDKKTRVRIDITIL